MSSIPARGIFISTRRDRMMKRAVSSRGVFSKSSFRRGTFSPAEARHETVAFCWLFLAPQQKAMGT
jgi:hypothetical protein